jgi:predicted permease
MTSNAARWGASDAVRLMLAPASEYRARLAERPPASWLRALTVPALVAVLLGLTTATAAAGHVSVRLVLSEILSWSFVPLLQLATGAMLIRSARARTVRTARAIELLFAAHGPWSLWLVGTALWQLSGPSLKAVIASAVVPHAATAYLLLVYGREVLGLTRSQARRRVFAHQTATVVLILLYIELATRLSLRIIGAFS